MTSIAKMTSQEKGYAKLKEDYEHMILLNDELRGDLFRQQEKNHLLVKLDIKQVELLNVAQKHNIKKNKENKKLKQQIKTMKLAFNEVEDNYHMNFIRKKELERVVYKHNLSIVALQNENKFLQKQNIYDKNLIRKKEMEIDELYKKPNGDDYKFNMN